MGFPVHRPRRLRRSELIRSLVRETDLSPGDLIAPLFVCPGKRVRREIPSMPGQYNLSVDEAVSEAQEARSLGGPAVRKALAAGGLDGVRILSSAGKSASGFYGPFRGAAQSTPKFGDRRSHQMDPANAREALKEALLDIEEGADIVMVKPALPYLDVIYRVRQAVNVPVAAFHVSGEYAMVAAAANNGWIDRERVVMESLHAIRRAGADLIVTYFAKEAARLLER